MRPVPGLGQGLARGLDPSLSLVLTLFLSLPAGGLRRVPDASERLLPLPLGIPARIPAALLPGSPTERKCPRRRRRSPLLLVQNLRNRCSELQRRRIEARQAVYTLGLEGDLCLKKKKTGLFCLKPQLCLGLPWGKAKLAQPALSVSFLPLASWGPSEEVRSRALGRRHCSTSRAVCERHGRGLPGRVPDSVPTCDSVAESRSLLA